MAYRTRKAYSCLAEDLVHKVDKQTFCHKRERCRLLRGCEVQQQRRRQQFRAVGGYRDVGSRKEQRNEVRRQPHYPDEKRVERLLGVVVQGLEILYKEVRNGQRERSAVHEYPDPSFVELRREGIRALAGPALREEPAAASLEKRLQIAALKYRVELHGFEPLLYVLKQLRRRLVA